MLRVNQLILPEENYLDENSAFSLMVDIEGSISGFTATKSYFVLFIEVKYKNKINQLELICIIPRLSEIQKDFELECYPWVDEDETYDYDEIILLPYATPNLSPQPYEVINNKRQKAISYSDYEGKSGFLFVKILLSLSLLLLLI